MKKKILLLVCAMVMALSATCFARALPNSEFTLGGICVAYGPTLDDVEASYGEPRLVSSRGSGNVYYFHESLRQFAGARLCHRGHGKQRLGNAGRPDGRHEEVNDDRPLWHDGFTL